MIFGISWNTSTITINNISSDYSWVRSLTLNRLIFILKSSILIIIACIRITLSIYRLFKFFINRHSRIWISINICFLLCREITFFWIYVSYLLYRSKINIWFKIWILMITSLVHKFIIIIMSIVYFLKIIKSHFYFFIHSSFWSLNVK